MSTLRVATLNVWHKSPPWPERLAKIREEVQILEPSVLGLQEVLRYAPREGAAFLATPSSCQATEIAHGLGYEVAYAEASDFSHGLKFGNALLSRYPITKNLTFPLPGRESGETRALLYAVVATPFGELPVFVTHLNWKLHHGSYRVQQVKFIVERIFELCPTRGELLPPVLMGDFNADPDSDEMRYLRGLKVEGTRSVYFADAWMYVEDGEKGATFDRRNPYAARGHEPNRRIDYILVRGPDALLRGEPTATRLCFATPSSGPEGPVFPSDHFGVRTDLYLAPRSP